MSTLNSQVTKLIVLVVDWRWPSSPRPRLLFHHGLVSFKPLVQCNENDIRAVASVYSAPKPHNQHSNRFSPIMWTEFWPGTTHSCLIRTWFPATSAEVSFPNYATFTWNIIRSDWRMMYFQESLYQISFLIHESFGFQRQSRLADSFFLRALHSLQAPLRTIYEPLVFTLWVPKV